MKHRRRNLTMRRRQRPRRAPPRTSPGQYELADISEVIPSFVEVLSSRLVGVLHPELVEGRTIVSGDPSNSPFRDQDLDVA